MTLPSGEPKSAAQPEDDFTRAPRHVECLDTNVFLPVPHYAENPAIALGLSVIGHRLDALKWNLDISPSPQKKYVAMVEEKAIARLVNRRAV
jgi:hypothetical protein